MKSPNGFTLMEMMVVVAIVAILVSIGSPLLQRQLAERETETMARRFIQHAQFARQAALFQGKGVELAPASGEWGAGWDVRPIDLDFRNGDLRPAPLLRQGSIDPVTVSARGSGFADPRSHQKRIAFYAGGTAKTESGAFVANRLIFGHAHVKDLERHAILSSGGRWRLCNPQQDSKACR